MSLESDIETLRRVELFAGFEDGQLRMLASGSERLELSTGDRVFDKDGLSNGGYVVVGGNIDLISGINRRIISSNGPGTLIGELGLISRVEHVATAIATEDTEVLRIPRELFLQMLNQHPQHAVMLQKRISKSIDDFSNKLEKIRAKLDYATHLVTRPKKNTS